MAKYLLHYRQGLELTQDIRTSMSDEEAGAINYALRQQGITPDHVTVYAQQILEHDTYNRRGGYNHAGIVSDASQSVWCEECQNYYLPHSH